MKFISKIMGIVLSLLSTTQLFAKADDWTQYGLRPLGMGNAYVAVADDFNAVFYNPAGLARLNDWYLEIINPGVTFSSGALDFFNEIASNSEGEEGVVDIIEDHAGESFTLEALMSPYFVTKHFGLAIGVEAGFNTAIHRDVSVSFEGGAKVIMPISVAFNFFDSKLSVGASLKTVLIGGVDKEFSIDAIADIDDGVDALENYVKSGYGFGVDVGILFTPVKFMEPTLGVSITDFGGTAFQELQAVADAVGKAKPILPSVNVGLSLKPVKTSGFYLMTTMDMHSINQPFSFSQKFNLGAEAGLGQIFKAQLGLHDGYYTAGMQFDVSVIKLRVVTYADEVGDFSGQQEDRRYALQLKFLI